MVVVVGRDPRESSQSYIEFIDEDGPVEEGSKGSGDDLYLIGLKG